MDMQHFPQAQTEALASMGLEGIRAFLSETVCSGTVFYVGQRKLGEI